MARSDELRLLTRVAQMYYLDGMKQTDIAAHLYISQTSISRMLRRAKSEGIVRISISAPRGTYPELEAALRRKFGLQEAIVADCSVDTEDHILSRIGEAAAYYVENTVEAGEKIGISSWSESLLRMVDNIRPLHTAKAAQVVQILGGMGNPAVQAHATNLTVQLAKLLGAEPLLLSAQGVASSPEARDALLEDPYVRSTVKNFASLSMVLVGIGAVQPSTLLARSGNVFAAAELADIKDIGAVGDVCLHFFDIEGRPVSSPLDERVIGIALDELKKVKRIVGVAGGERKTDAILGAMRGRFIDVLVTDRFSAERLIARS